MRRRGVVFAFAAAGFERAAAQAARSAAGRAGGAPGAGASSDPGLLRLEAALAQHLAASRNALPLPWHETILEPDKARLVWRPRSLRAPNSRDRFRVAIDPPTRWYYVGRVDRDGRLTLYGPIDERATGRFVDALAPDAVPDARSSRAAPVAERGRKPGAPPSR